MAEAKINNRLAKQAERAIEKSSGTMLDFIAPSSYLITPNNLQINNLFVKTYFVYAYPRFLNANWLSPIINYDIAMDVSIHIAPLDSNLFLDRMRKQAGRLESTKQIEQEKGLVRNPQLDQAIGDIDQLRDDLVAGQQRIFKCGMYFTLYAKSMQELTETSERLVSTLGGLLVYTKQAVFQAEQGFHTTLTIGEDELQISKNLDTNSLSTSFPFVSAELTSNKGILYGINRHNNSLILFDRFDLENANEVVFAKSGAGKSYTVKLEALRSLMLGTDVIVVDPENEYQALCDAVGGSFFDFSLNSDKRVNPFDLPAMAADEDGEMILRTAITDVKGLIALMVGGVTPEEDAILDKAIYDTYALRDITADITTQKNPAPLLSDLQGVLMNTKGAESLARRLTKYTEGTFSGLFNKPTNFELERGFIVFSIRNLEEALRPLAMYMILNYIWARIRKEMRQRILIVDEAWILMQYPDSARYLYSLAKRARKYYLGLTIISQDVEDFLSNEQGRAVLNNSSLQILLKQSPAAVEKLAQVFHLTEGEKFLLLESDVGEGLFFAGASHVAIKVVASYAEDQIITTDPKALLAQQAAKQESDTIDQTPIEATYDDNSMNVSGETAASMPQSAQTPQPVEQPASNTPPQPVSQTPVPAAPQPQVVQSPPSAPVAPQLKPVQVEQSPAAMNPPDNNPANAINVHSPLASTTSQAQGTNQAAPSPPATPPQP